MKSKRAVWLSEMDSEFEKFIAYVVIALILVVVYKVLLQGIDQKEVLDQKCRSYENSSMLFTYQYNEKCHYISNDSNLWKCSRKIVEINNQTLIGKLVCEVD